MQFKTVREAFNWLNTNKDGRDDLHCWSGVLEHEHKAQFRNCDCPSARNTFTLAELLCLQCRNSGNTPGAKERLDLENFTNCQAEAALAAVRAYCDDLVRRQQIVSPTAHPR